MGRQNRSQGKGPGQCGEVLALSQGGRGGGCVKCRSGSLGSEQKGLGIVLSSRAPPSERIV